MHECVRVRRSKAIRSIHLPQCILLASTRSARAIFLDLFGSFSRQNVANTLAKFWREELSRVEDDVSRQHILLRVGVSCMMRRDEGVGLTRSRMSNECIESIILEAVMEGIDAIISIGGGSAMDSVLPIAIGTKTTSSYFPFL